MIIENILNVNEFLFTKKLIVDAAICYHCNFNCEYCGNNYETTHGHEKCMNLNKLFNFLKKHENDTESGYCILLNGGEPTLHPHLFEFCKKSHEIKDTTIYIISNMSQSVEYYKKLTNTGVGLIASFHISQDTWESFYEKTKETNVRYIFVPIDTRYDMDWLKKYMTLDKKIKPQIIQNREIHHKTSSKFIQDIMNENRGRMTIFHQRIKHYGSMNYYVYISENGNIYDFRLNTGEKTLKIKNTVAQHI